MKIKRFCPNCGTEILPRKRSCHECGLGRGPTGMPHDLVYNNIHGQPKWRYEIDEKRGSEEKVICDHGKLDCKLCKLRGDI